MASEHPSSVPALSHSLAHTTTIWLCSSTKLSCYTPQYGHTPPPKKCYQPLFGRQRKQKNRCYYPHGSRDLVSPVCVFFLMYGCFYFVNIYSFFTYFAKGLIVYTLQNKPFLNTAISDFMYSRFSDNLVSTLKITK